MFFSHPSIRAVEATLATIYPPPCRRPTGWPPPQRRGIRTGWSGRRQHVRL